MTTTPADMSCESNLDPDCLWDDAKAPTTRRVDWDMFGIWTFTAFSFTALYFAFFLLAAKCDGTWPL